MVIPTEGLKQHLAVDELLDPLTVRMMVIPTEGLKP